MTTGIYLEGLKQNVRGNRYLGDCPECEEDAGVLRQVIYPISKRPAIYFVECVKCGHESDYADTPDGAVDNWNGDEDDDE